jgi:eukaryotic-like serine/threonine-protein kinase
VTHSGLGLDVRYKLDSPIAAGGVGQVWRGTDRVLQRPVAVKLLRPEYTAHPETLTRFRAEARHAGALNHPCVAQVYDYCDGGPDASPYLVMELVDGPSLAEVLDEGSIDAARALDIIAQAAAGLAAAHRTGLVHRDIKPANILLSPDGMVKITDFGIAHAAGSAPVTSPEVVMGTAQYLAPERITTRGGSPASDLYSLGIVLYECLAGQPPFAGTAAEVTAAHLYHALPPLPPDVPPAISELIARLTTKDPAVRLADASELATTAGRLSAILAAAPASSAPGEPALMAESSRLVKPAKNPELAQRTTTDTRPADNRRRRLLAMTTTAAVLAAFCCWLAFGPLRLTATQDRPAPLPSAHVLTPPANVAIPGAHRGGTPSHGAAGKSGQRDKPNAAPSPNPRSGATSASKRNTSPAKKAGPGHAAGAPSATSTPEESGSSGSDGSGGGLQLQLPLPVPSISLGL